MAGNNSPETIKKNIQMILIKLKKNKMISVSEFNEILNIFLEILNIFFIFFTFKFIIIVMENKGEPVCFSPAPPAAPARFYFSFALRRFPPSPTLCRLMLARSNGPVLDLDAQRTFNHQTATALRGAYLQPLSRALPRPHALTRTVASLRLATAIYA